MVQIESLIIEEVELAPEPLTAYFRIRVSIVGDETKRTVMKTYADILELLGQLPPLLHLPSLPRQVDEHLLAQDDMYRTVLQAQLNGLTAQSDLMREAHVLDFFQASVTYAVRRPSNSLEEYRSDEVQRPDVDLFNNALKALSPFSSRRRPSPGRRHSSPMGSRSQTDLLGSWVNPTGHHMAGPHTRSQMFTPPQRSVSGLEYVSAKSLQGDPSNARGAPRHTNVPNTWPQVTSDATSSTAAAPASSSLLWEFPASSHQSVLGLHVAPSPSKTTQGVRSMPEAQLASMSVPASQSSLGSHHSQSDSPAMATPTKLCWDLPVNAATITPQQQFLLPTQTPVRQYLLPTREAPLSRPQDPIEEEALSTGDAARSPVRDDMHDDHTSHEASSSAPEVSVPTSPEIGEWSPSQVPPDLCANAHNSSRDGNHSSPPSVSSPDIARSGVNECLPKMSSEATPDKKRSESTKKTRTHGRAKCVICFAKPEEIAVDPCGHLSMCKECSEKVQQCPVCRAPIEKRLRVFIVR